MNSVNKDINQNLPKSWRPRVVVVGGGFAGINLIKSLKNEDIDLVLVDKNNYHVFRPLIYQVATAGLEPGAISSSLRGMFQKQKNIHFRKAEAKEILKDKYQLVTSAGTIDYDYLVLASGSKGNFYNNKMIEENGLTINNLQDALKIRELFIQNFEEALLSTNPNIPELLNVIIVGGGPTGVELAGAFAELRKNVLPEDYPDFNTSNLAIYLIEAQKSLLPEMTKKSGKKAKRYLRSLGVTILNNTSVKSFEDDSVRLNNGKEIKSNLLIWAAGMKGNIIAGFTDEQISHGRLVVDQYNRIKGTRNIFAIGDLALQKDNKYPKGLPMLAPVAIQQSIHLAQNILRMSKGKKPTPFKFRNKGIMATVGRNKAVVELPGKIKYGGILGWLTWVFVHLLSIVGLRRKLVVLAHWIWSYLTYDKGNRLILRRFKEG